MKFKQEKPTDLSYIPPRILDAVLERVERKLRHLVPKMGNFRDVYGDDEIDGDKKTVADLRDRYAENEEKHESFVYMNKIAKIMEGITTDQIQNWLSKKFDAYPTCEYDDFLRGIDAVLEFTGSGDAKRHMGLAIDITFSNKNDIIDKKIKRNFEKIKSGSVSEVKYFENDPKGDDPLFRGSVEAPRFIFLIEPEIVKELINLENEDKKVDLASHRVQVSLIRQMMVQVEAYLEYAEKKGQGEVAEKYGNIMDIFKETMDDKLEGGEFLIPTEKDRSLEILSGSLRRRGK